MAVVIVQTSNPNGVATSANVAEYVATSGTAAADRMIVVCCGCESTVTIDSATIDGSAMNAGPMANFNSMKARQFYLPWPTGTTATVRVTHSGTAAVGTTHLALYSVTGADTTLLAVGTSNTTDMDASAPVTTGVITIPSSGGFLAVVAGSADTTAKTWAVALEDIDADVGTFRFTTAILATATSSATITCTGGNTEDGAMAWMSFNPGSNNKILLASAGSYAYTGTDASLERGFRLTASAGSYAYTGTDASLEVGHRVLASAGSYAYTGTDAALTIERLLSADGGIYAYTGTDATLTVSSNAPAATTALTGHWRGPAGGKRRRHTPGQPRLLSELDPPLFTPEEILGAPGSYNVDAATRAEIEAIALEAFADVMDTAARRNLQRMHYDALLAKERAMVDDEETFLLM